MGHPEFPHHSTAQIIFDRETFWAYTQLGMRSAASLFEAIQAHPGEPRSATHPVQENNMKPDHYLRVNPYAEYHGVRVTYTHATTCRGAVFCHANPCAVSVGVGSRSADRPLPLVPHCCAACVC